MNDLSCPSAGVPFVVGSDYRNQTIFNEYVAVESCIGVLQACDLGPSSWLACSEVDE